VPSRHPDGRRFCGNDQRKKKAALAALDRRGEYAGLPVPAALADVEPPPLDRGVAAVEAWAAGVNLLCAVAAEAAAVEELPRLQAALGVLTRLGRLKDKAKTSADACEARRLRLGEAVDLTADVPPGDAVAAVAWSFFRLARILHAVVADPAWLPDRSLLAVGFLATAGFLPVKADVADIVERIKAEE
jgi:hypothetical protein